ncbi:MAG TPA: 2-succinyl-5-enolpyruvyl-6-hydroxy-3-cyclohexene-1-carboxylic-acid synthase, partial [Ilumatobacteraceae bacterium]|nr:2-succinyl-5-enolpyruvyl-6-hydroxy-3-cyclohexene-1-carboxylic-acid synthase [Ilumatobacteraceae bacterium]
MSVAATFCATLVDEWVRLGVRHGVVAPGSRSTPMAVALASNRDIAVHVVHDERVAAFVALGIGLDGVPAVLLCTSGTAAANFHPAVVEAGLSDVPMLVVTSDRPPELRDVGAPQTIDQTHLYSRAVRWFHDPGVPDVAGSSTWRSLAFRAVNAARHGPVHLNLPFREPLTGTPGELPPPSGREPVSPDVDHPADATPGAISSTPGAGAVAGEAARHVIDRQRGVIIAGGRSGVPVARVAALADATGWPVLADPTSGARSLPAAVTTFDSLLRHRDFADAHTPEVVVRIGRQPASRVLAEWITRSSSVVVQVGGPGVVDPGHDVAFVCRIDDLDGLRGSSGTTWSARWRHAEARALEAIEAALAAEESLTEPGVAHVIAASLPDGVGLVVASSMPVRDLEWYGGPPAHAHANRGANGIDGVVSTALGRTLAGVPTVALVGDIAFVHDSNALVGLSAR